MRICQLELRNFRGIKEGKVNLPRHAVLLGANNSGKTTIAEALALLFGRERMVKYISDWDFYRGSPKPESRFYIIGTITDFDTSKNDPTEFPDWFLGDRVARPVWWNEEKFTISYDTDPPEGTRLAAQLALAGRFDDETCEFETTRYFYDGESDPFIDSSIQVPFRILRQLGVFLLSSNREWDKLLSFGSSTLLKVIREYEALPGKTIDALKKQLRTDVAKVEEASPLAEILGSAEKELRSFLLMGHASNLIYRPTSLDAFSVLQSLVAHVSNYDGSIVPVSRHGAGMISLQAFLLLLAFAEQRKKSGRNFILVAEEPELHLHPSLHQLLVHRIRAASNQSIVTTQSPNVSAAYQPHKVIFIQNKKGNLKAKPLRNEPIKKIPKNSVRKLYLIHRERLYEAFMGGVIIVPEGIYDHEWLCLWQRLAQSSPEVNKSFLLRPIAIVPTEDAAISETYEEIARLRPDAIPLVDGDKQGQDYLDKLSGGKEIPRRIIRLGQNAGIECLSAWILEPALSNPGETLLRIIPEKAKRNVKVLKDVLTNTTNKKDRELRENLVWESLNCAKCCLRSGEFFHDIAAIGYGETPHNPSWITEKREKDLTLFTAFHIRRS